MVVEDDKASSMLESDERMTGWVSEDMSLVNQVNIIIYSNMGINNSHNVHETTCEMNVHL
jgi:hypothetical protein